MEVLPNTLFRVKTVDGKILLCHLSGRLRIKYVHILPGDKIRLETTAYDENKGRIIYRYK